MIVIFEGADASGKDYMRAEFNKRNQYEDDAVVRFGFSSLVYAAYYKRPLWTCRIHRIEYVRMMRRFMQATDPLIIFTYASQETTDYRIQKRGESVSTHAPAKVINNLYKKMFELVKVSRRSMLEFDTTGGTKNLYEQLSIIQSRLKYLKEKNHVRRKCGCTSGI